MQENQAMLLVILNKPAVKRQWQFLNLLEREQTLGTSNPDNALQVYLKELYELETKQTEHKFRILVNDEYEKMANSMLQFEEEAHLMEYEIGIDMYQRVQDFHFDEEKSAQPARQDRVGKAVYSFQGEFWNDELNAYEVELPNKCENAEEWDIFFK
jgi:hypothetical protein